MKVLVINQCSTNKGDRAVLFFVLRELVRNGVDQITVSASNPEYWQDKPDFPGGAVRVVPWGWDISRRKGVGLWGKVIHRVRKLILPRRICFPLVRNALIAGKPAERLAGEPAAHLAGKRPWYLRFIVNRQYLETIEQADLVLSTGGHHITTMFVPDAVTPQIFDMAVALLCGKRLVLWSQSIGPFDFASAKSKLMVQRLLAGAEQIFTRDEASADQIRRMGVSLERVSRTFESVFGLCDVVKSPARPSERSAVMGVAVYVYVRRPRTNCTKAHEKEHRNKGTKAQRLKEHENYARCFAPLIDHAIEAGYKVRFFPMELAGTDRACIEAVINSVDKKENCEILEGFPGTCEHLNDVARCRMFVGHKTHSQVFSLVAATPLLAVAYHKKTEDFMAQFGLERHCVDDAQISAGKLIEMFDEINNNLDAISHKQQEVGSKICAQVKDDFAKMIEKLKIEN
jgi:polysaccharide pyruvyl transferase WcaK-like protein